MASPRSTKVDSRTLTDIEEPCACAVYSPDGKKVALSGGADGTVKIIDANTGTCVVSLPTVATHLTRLLREGREGWYTAGPSRASERNRVAEEWPGLRDGFQRQHSEVRRCHRRGALLLKRLPCTGCGMLTADPLSPTRVTLPLFAIAQSIVVLLHLHRTTKRSSFGTSKQVGLVIGVPAFVHDMPRAM